ncbi:hypothetical protein V6N11_045080 [Hibiscus sabdariffa]|uniref:Uncharacterized protein n=1 Tax=Hibiscus sabdariffa TaxID=183260 RepID=A0ABR2A6T2_9ROSI
MDPERPHGGSSGSSISDLFICFTSGHYFSRRMMVRNNSSLKSGQQQASPMFSNGKKKGPGFDNPEPSSPKVTCIGQVRVNKGRKKQGKKLRACRSDNGGGNGTCQECKKWVHLPLTMCEALRAFGAEYFHCLLPCGRSSSSMANQRDSKENKTGDGSGEIIEISCCNERRHVFEDVEEDQDQARFSISSSTPPKDALLMMRCRSDPVKMAAFADKLCWETQNPENEDQEQGQQEITTMKEETLTPVSFDDTEKLHQEERSKLECPEAMEPDPGNESKESGSQKNLLPDCLLLMMCEPKLSMEVSKETWVCSGDFIKQPLVKQKDGGDEPPVSLQPPPPPPASSCSLTADLPLVTEECTTGDDASGGGSTVTVVDQKLVGGKGCEPFVLTRCMSEPIRLSAKLAPNAC